MADIILIIFMNVFLTCHIRYYYHAANFIAIFLSALSYRCAV